MPNRLANSTSPYLLQHQNNPVDWYPWSDEALNKAKNEDKPIFLSIGYAACHWCHVMEHESFENEGIAKLLNEHFVSIKVDREQRPDLDHIYMQTVQMLTGSGGWPMSVFLTADMKPFYGGTYWPPTRRWGKPGFGEVLEAIVDAWQNKRGALMEQSQEITRHLQEASTAKPKPDGDTSSDAIELSMSLLNRADQWLDNAFDEQWGGFGGAPKFPHAMDIRLLMDLQTRSPTDRRLRIITHTLNCMADGGIYDHVGGGFARYSVDEKWLVPHFEKMLYDNALLANVYIDGFQLTGNERYATVVRETLDYVLEDLTDSSGGFYCTRDADSEGEEGKFYVWSRTEILDLLGQERGNTFCEAYGVTFGGNFEGHNILNHPEPLERIAVRLGMPIDELRQQLASDRAVLKSARNQRIWPSLDDKVLCSWNALMIPAMARAGITLGSPKYLAAAERAADFIESDMTHSNGRLLHVWRRGVAEIDGFLEDYSYLADALITLFECTGNPKYLERSVRIANKMVELFSDESGGFFFTPSDGPELITRYKDEHDGSVPSGNAMASTALVRLACITNSESYWQLAETSLQRAVPLMERSPGASAQMLHALDHYLGPREEIVVVASDEQVQRDAIARLNRAFRPRRVLVASQQSSDGINSLAQSPASELVRDRPLTANRDIAFYKCIDGTCSAPVYEWNE